MLHQLKLRNFKAVGDPGFSLDLAPLTLLIGKNGSGKTSVHEALALLVQSCGDRNSSGLNLDGSLVSFPSDDVLFHRRDKRQALTIGITADSAMTGEAPWWRSEVRWANVEGPSSISFEFDYSKEPERPQGDWSQLLTFDGRPVGIVRRRSRAVAGGVSTESDFEVPVYGWKGSSSDAERLLSRSTFGTTIVNSGATPAPAVFQFVNRMGATAGRLADALRSSVVSLSATRGAELYVREVGEVVLSAGRFGESTTRLLSIIQADVARSEAFDRIKRWAARFGLANLTGGWVGRNELSLGFADPFTKTALPLTSAGSGSQHILPFIVDCFASLSPRILLIDEIEQGLHPRWVVDLAELFAEAVSLGHQLIVTTQSPTLVLAVCAAIAEGKLNSKNVALHGLDRTAEGSVAATRDEISSSGAIKGGWIRAFADVERQLLTSFMNGQHDARDDAADQER